MLSIGKLASITFAAFALLILAMWPSSRSYGGDLSTSSATVKADCGCGLDCPPGCRCGCQQHVSVDGVAIQITVEEPAWKVVSGSLQSFKTTCHGTVYYDTASKVWYCPPGVCVTANGLGGFTVDCCQACQDGGCTSAGCTGVVSGCAGVTGGCSSGSCGTAGSSRRFFRGR
jgi:hypothetical protein